MVSMRHWSVQTCIGVGGLVALFGCTSATDTAGERTEIVGQATQAASAVEREDALRWMALQQSFEMLPYCYKRTMGRGVGRPLHACSGDNERSYALCYPRCAPGFHGVGPVCWGSCPEGFRDDGAYCGKPSPYGRGAGFPWKVGDAHGSLEGARARCEAENPRGCEQNGALYYPKCSPGYHAVGCCTCSPDCEGMVDIGVSCQKPSYGRGVGVPMECDSNEDADAGLCYNRCAEGYHGVGPVCWQTCPRDRPVECGVGCAKTGGDCAVATTEMVTAPIFAALQTLLLTKGGGVGQEVANAAKDAVKRALELMVRFDATPEQREAAKKSFEEAAGKLWGEFEKIASKGIVDGLKSRYGLDGYITLATEYVKALLVIAEAQGKGDDVLRALTELSGVDPTGIAAVAKEFWRPMCSAPGP